MGDEELKRITDERLETYFENQKHAIEVSEKMNLNESDFVEVSKPQGAKVGSNVGIKIKSLNIKYVTKNSKTERMQTEGNIC